MHGTGHPISCWGAPRTLVNVGRRMGVARCRRRRAVLLLRWARRVGHLLRAVVALQRVALLMLLRAQRASCGHLVRSGTWTR